MPGAATQLVLALTVPPGASVGDAIRASGILEHFPEIDLELNRVGVFGEPSRLEAAVRDGDRIEIYRPLAIDPKEARRRRAARKHAAPARPDR